MQQNSKLQNSEITSCWKRFTLLTDKKYFTVLELDFEFDFWLRVITFTNNFT